MDYEINRLVNLKSLEVVKITSQRNFPHFLHNLRLRESFRQVLLPQMIYLRFLDISVIEEKI